jgi:hypothetical protein
MADLQTRLYSVFNPGETYGQLEIPIRGRSTVPHPARQCRNFRRLSFPIVEPHSPSSMGQRAEIWRFQLKPSEIGK